MLRGLVGSIGLLALLFAGVLLLSDRVPGLLKAVFGERAKSLWARIDSGGRTDAITGAVRPETDLVVHVAIWAAVACLLGLAVWSWLGLIGAGMGVFGVSVITEFAQGVWSSTREVEATDVVANAVGAAGGVSAAAAVYVLWSGVAALFSRPG